VERLVGLYTVVLAGLDGAYDWRCVSSINLVGDCLEPSDQTMACVFGRFHVVFPGVVPRVAERILEKVLNRRSTPSWFVIELVVLILSNEFINITSGENHFL